MFKISVIIPCYNVEAYIDRCLESVMSQTIGLEHLEVIAVNDASTDRTLEKLYQWERRFPENIMVITYEKNIRQGGARNIGLQYASGEYIGFVDADDWIDSAMYQKLFIFRRKLPMKIIIGKVF
jgi:glycosyltransferase involved in cell wall biosynthesis